MAAPLIEPFSPTQSDRWQAWSERLEFIMESEDITAPERKCAYLCRVCGPDTYDLISSLLAPAKVSDTCYSDIMAALRKHFGPKQPELTRRFEFSRRTQAPGESITEYVAALRAAARDCNFAELDNMLRDRLVFGTRDALETIKRSHGVCKEKPGTVFGRDQKNGST